jgi:hypothetical protein
LKEGLLLLYSILHSGAGHLELLDLVAEQWLRESPLRVKWCQEMVHCWDSEVCWGWHFPEEVQRFRVAVPRFPGEALPLPELVRHSRELDLFGQALRFDRPLPDGPRPIRSRCFEPSAMWP